LENKGPVVGLNKSENQNHVWFSFEAWDIPILNWFSDQQQALFPSEYKNPFKNLNGLIIKYTPNIQEPWKNAGSYTRVFTVFLPFIVLGLATFSLRTKVLVVLTVLHGIVALVSLFYFVAVRQLNKPTPEKPNAKLSNSDENHVN